MHSLPHTATDCTHLDRPTQTSGRDQPWRSRETCHGARPAHSKKHDTHDQWQHNLHTHTLDKQASHVTRGHGSYTNWMQNRRAREIGTRDVVLAMDAVAPHPQLPTRRDRQRVTLAGVDELNVLAPDLVNRARQQRVPRVAVTCGQQHQLSVTPVLASNTGVHSHTTQRRTELPVRARAPRPHAHARGHLYKTHSSAFTSVHDHNTSVCESRRQSLEVMQQQ